MKNPWEVLRPLSPYRARLDLPSFRLFARVNDDRTHGVWRILVMAVWAALGAALSVLIVVALVLWHKKSSAQSHTLLITAFAVAVMVDIKLDHVLAPPRYPVDILDWCCDVGSWGVAGAYTAAHLLLHVPVNPMVYLCLAALWVVTYPWSTPR